MAAKKVVSKIAIPSHAKKIDNALNGFWKPVEPGHALQGVVGRAVETKGADGQPNTFYMLRLTKAESGPIEATGGKPVEVEVGMVVGVGGRTLAGFFESNPGAEVILVFLGLGPKKPGKNPPKMYDTYIVDESSE